MAVDSTIDDGSANVPTPTKPRHPIRTLIEWITVVALALVLALVLRANVVQTFFIPSGSMIPTLQVGDRIVVSKLSVEWGTIHRGDIVVFRRPPREDCGGAEVNDLVKRVIGLPGDRLTSKGNTIYINGRALHETWSHTEPLGTPIDPITVPKDEYFMMGDNHGSSCDSRYWGPIKRSLIVGKVFMRVWPLSRFSFL